MLIRYGLAHVLAFLPTLLILVLTAVAAGRLWSKGRPGLGKLLGFIGVLVALAAPVVFFSYGKTLWVVSEGSSGELEGRRYHFMGAQATWTLADGKTIPLAVHEGHIGEMLVNDTRGPLVVETVQFGGVSVLAKKQEQRVNSGEAADIDFVNEVGLPPKSMPVSAKSTVAYGTYIHKP